MQLLGDWLLAGALLGSLASPARAAPSSNLSSELNALYSCDRPTVKEAGKRRCPDFGDNDIDIYCCPSKKFQGKYYCCDEKVVHLIEDEKQQAAFQHFLRNELPVIVAALAACLVVVLITLFICFRHSRCPLYRSKQSDKDAYVCTTTATASARRPPSTGTGSAGVRLTNTPGTGHSAILSTSRQHSSRLSSSRGDGASHRSSSGNTTIAGNAAATPTATATALNSTSRSTTPVSVQHRTALYGRPQNGAEPKPLLFEAPPPYGLAQHYPATPPVMTDSEYTTQNLHNAQRMLYR